ncbi:hypothetical protein TBLA_0B05930 [Henningerozyma blattae CBS 6284]|uniref:non-specific serine/threonine protein kinase n=1 Tax=Henningerozyma blattae (strain ATCC 34711 / CBS 6284 / DSM 70876 / NBRC 10599 / NRRL Y-10934 / UCD 77-7) TaxID=1071380 RepID=I2GZ67_HENB6|nr:hypothetical protein TBLA_0B05930 [Tetrapisispora blattae CBS 6284]CCH59419.1 hypothetical protein TBLA_0B05930 [Tetrapisispora blattae CBS 6284]
MNQPHIKNYDPGTKLNVGIHQVSIIKYLTSGGFAQIYQVQVNPPNPINGMNLACLKRVIVPEKSGLNTLRAEVEAMQLLKGKPHVVGYIDSNAARSISNDGTYEVLQLMEFCPGGGLIDFMNTRLQNRLKEFEVLNIMNQVTQGIVAMHSLNPPLIHRDIKIENVLISSNGEYKVCDFGSVSGIIRPPKNTEEFNFVQQDIMKNTTAQYRCPEMLDLYRGQPINEKSDIWALGVFLYKICYYTTPFENGGERAILHARYQYPQYPMYSSRLKNLIRMMLMEKPEQRPNVCQVLEEVSSMQGIPCPLPNFYLQRQQATQLMMNNTNGSIYPIPTQNTMMNQMPPPMNMMNNSQIAAQHSSNMMPQSIPQPLYTNYSNNSMNANMNMSPNYAYPTSPIMSQGLFTGPTLHHNLTSPISQPKSKSENTTGNDDPFAKLKDQALFNKVNANNTNTSVNDHSFNMYSTKQQNMANNFNNNNSNNMNPLMKQRSDRTRIFDMPQNKTPAMTQNSVNYLLPGHSSEQSIRKSTSSTSLRNIQNGGNQVLSQIMFNNNKTGERTSSTSSVSAPSLSKNMVPYIPPNSFTSTNNAMVFRENESSKASIKLRVQNLLKTSNSGNNDNSLRRTTSDTQNGSQSNNSLRKVNTHQVDSNYTTSEKKKAPKPPPKPDYLRPKKPPKPANLQGMKFMKSENVEQEIKERKENSKKQLQKMEVDFSQRYPSV